MTFADALIKVRGYYLNIGYRSADFRALLSLTYNINAKHKKTPQQLWELNIDNEFKKDLTHDEIKERNARIREQMKSGKKSKFNTTL